MSIADIVIICILAAAPAIVPLAPHRQTTKTLI